MLKMCIADFAATVGGQLIWSSMPPLAGGLEPVRRIVINSSIATPGDVYWSLHSADYHGEIWVHEAFARGAIGAVISTHYVEPWAGKFTLHTDDSNIAFCRFVRLLEGSALRGRSPVALGVVEAERLLQDVAKNDLDALTPIIAIQKRQELDGNRYQRRPELRANELARSNANIASS